MEIINFERQKTMQLTKEHRELHKKNYMNQTTFYHFIIQELPKDNLILQEKMLRDTKPFHFH